MLKIEIRNKNLTLLVPIILVILVVVRLAWVQIREYPVYISPSFMQTNVWFSQHFRDVCVYQPRLPVAAQLEPVAPADALINQSAGLALLMRYRCLQAPLDVRYFYGINQWLTVAYVIAIAFLVRLAAGSWTLALFAAVVLLNHGRLLSLIGSLSTRVFGCAAVSFWFLGALHFLRTAAPSSLIFMTLVSALGGLFHPLLWLLQIAMVPYLCFVPVFRRSLAVDTSASEFLRQGSETSGLPASWRHAAEKLFGWVDAAWRWLLWFLRLEPQQRSDNPESTVQERRGSMLRPLQQPFMLWVLKHRRILRLNLFWLCSALVLGAGVWVGARFSGIQVESAQLFDQFHDTEFSLQRLRDFIPAWLSLIFEDRIRPADLQVFFCFVMICVGLVAGQRRGLPYLVEVALLFLCTAGVLASATCVLDYFLSHGQVFLLSSRAAGPGVLLWFEPVILGVGIAATYLLVVSPRRSLRS